MTTAITTTTTPTIAAPGLQLRPYPSATQSPVVAALGARSAATRRKHAQSLRVLSALVAGAEDAPIRWETLQPAHVAMLRRALSEQYAPATVNRHLSALRAVLRAAHALGLLSRDTLDDLLDAAESVPVHRAKFDTGRLITEEEFGMMLATCDDSPLGRRDAAILAILYWSGLRRAEVASLRLAQYDRAGRHLVDVVGKGDKKRPVPIPVNARLGARLNAWLAVRGDAPGPLFCQVRRGGHVHLHGLTAQAVYNVVRNRATAAGLDAEEIAAHDFRRTFITNALAASEGNTVLVSDLVGHEDPTTTSRYNRAALQAYRDLIDRM